MKTIFTQKRRFFALTIWACGFPFILGAGCTRGKTQTLPVANEQCLEIEGDGHLSASLRRLASGCLESEKKPAIYAHFIQQTLHDRIGFEDVVSNQGGKMSCSPGPYLTAARIADQNNGKWNLSSTPDYFVWHLTGSLEQNIYITNQSGFPIKSQVIRLQNENEATLVLLPKAVFDEGSTYYMYLTINQNDERQTWVQPITIGVLAKE